MKGVNKVIVLGNCGNDPEIKAFADGGIVANLSVATSESWKDKQTGEKKERTEWHRIVFRNKLAEIVRDYVKKGSKVYVEGSLRTRKYEKDGQTHYTTEVYADQMQMLDSRPDNGAAPARQNNTMAMLNNAADDFESDDIPFN